MQALNVGAYTVSSCLGLGRAAHLDALRAGRSGLSAHAFETCTVPTWTGQVPGLERALSGEHAAWDCRNNRHAELALDQDGFRDEVARLRMRYGAQRVGVFVGTSTSGMHQTELAYALRERAAEKLPEWFDFRRTHNLYSAAAFVRTSLGLNGVSLAISTACTSSAKVFASAQRAIVAGLCDATVVGGVDSLCLTTLHGFNALQLTSREPCRPADPDRDGISIGEAAGFAILDPAAGGATALLGYGESSDAWHMSAPDPEGCGARLAMSSALQRAGLAPGEIDYINLHGTATRSNDLAECAAVHALFGPETPCSSTKGWTGHTLGAAGIVEAAICLSCIEHGFLPRSLNTRVKDPQLDANILLESSSGKVGRVMSNSFGFGGTNCSLLFGARA